MPGWYTPTPRKLTLPPDWPKVRARILQRDGYRCTWLVDGVRCNARATDVDHIVRGTDHRDSNLRSLCHPHHHRKSSAEGGRARRNTTKYNVKRPPEQHPGLKRKNPPG